MPMALKYEIAFHFHLSSCIWKNKWESGYNYLCLNVNYPIVLKWLCYHLWNRISLSSHDLFCSFAALVSFFKFIWIAEFCFIKHQKNNQCEFVRFLVKGHWTIFCNFLFAEFYLSCKMHLPIWKIQKLRFNFFFLKMKKSSIFVKHVKSWDEAIWYSCCCLKHDYFKSI